MTLTLVTIIHHSVCLELVI